MKRDNEMELRDFFFDCLKGRDASSFEDLVHEDFIYIRETEMFTRDEFRSQVIEEFLQGVMISKTFRCYLKTTKSSSSTPTSDAAKSM